MKENEIVKVLPNFKKFNSYIEDIKNKVSPVMLSGLTDVAKTHFEFSTFFYSEKPICIITYNELQARKIINDLKYFTEDIDYFPKREIFEYDYIAENSDISAERIKTLNNIKNNKKSIIVTTIEAVMQKIVPKKDLFKNIIEFKTGTTINLEEIKQNLLNLGYERNDIVESVNTYSIRGGILDIAISNKQGVRIELWGDEIDSIRKFDISTQRSTEKLEKAKIYPATEFVLTDSLNNIIQDIINTRNEVPNDDIELLKSGEYLSKVDKYFNSFYKKTETIIDYIKDEYIIFLDEINKIKTRTENVQKDNELLIKSLIEKNRIVPDSLTILDDYLVFIESIKNTQTVYLEKQDIGFVDKQSMHAKRNGYSFSYREVNFFRSSMDLLFKELQKGIEKNKTIVILCGSKENRNKAVKLLTENLGEVILNRKNIIISEGDLSTGFECYDFNLEVITLKEIFVKNNKRKRLTQEFKQGETVIFSDLKIGDYIVHKTNGIGRFIGVNTIKADGITKDYIKIAYKDDDILYVPTNNLDNIRKYIGAGDRAPKINRLGSKEWENTKQKVKSNLKEIARDLIELYAKREKIKGFAYSKDTEWQKEFEGSFEFQETDDQLRAIEELKKDMEMPKPMDRLLCGDVGYRKNRSCN